MTKSASVFRTLGSRFARPTDRAAGRGSRRGVVEPLERRTLLSVAVGSAIPNTFGLPGGDPTDINLAGTFDDTSVAGTVVRFNTSLGNVDIELYDQAAVRTAQNFVNYVANSLYNQTVVHRLVKGFVLQGGGYLSTGAHIQEGPPVKNEFSASRPNVRGTIAMAKIPATDSQGNPIPGGGPDSATSEWFINLADNPGLDGQNGGFTVFGQVINGTMSTVDAIAGLPVHNASGLTPVFSELPVRNVPSGNPTNDDFVFVNSAGVIPDTGFLTLTATSDDPAVVNPAIANGVLRLNYGAVPGSARITVTATDSAGNAASQTFVAGVGEYEVQLGAGGVGSSISFTEADGGKGTVSLAKGGTAFVRFAGDSLTVTDGKKPALAGTVSAISGITTIDTGTGSVLTVKSSGGDGVVKVGGISSDGPLKALSLKGAQLSGTSTIGGTVKTAAVAGLQGATLAFGGDPADGIQLGLSVGTAVDSSISSGMPIKSVKATEFLATDVPGTITAPGVGSVAVKGAFRQSINTASAIKNIKVGGPQKGDITADSVGKVTAAALEGGIWNFTQAFASGRNAVGKVVVKGAIAGTTIRAAGNIGSISAVQVNSGRFYAGADVPDEEFPPFLPASLAQFVSPAKIGQVKVTQGISQLAMAAANLGKLTVGEVATDNPIPFGLAAAQVQQFTGRTADTDLGPGVPFNFRNLDDQATFDANVAAAQLPLGNYIVTLF